MEDDYLVLVFSNGLLAFANMQRLLAWLVAYKSVNTMRPALQPYYDSVKGFSGAVAFILLRVFQMLKALLPVATFFMVVTGGSIGVYIGKCSSCICWIKTVIMWRICFVQIIPYHFSCPYTSGYLQLNVTVFWRHTRVASMPICSSFYVVVWVMLVSTTRITARSNTQVGMLQKNVVVSDRNLVTDMAGA